MKRLLAFAGVFLLICGGAFAAAASATATDRVFVNVNSVAAIAVNGHVEIDMSLGNPLVAGEPPAITGSPNTTSRLFYTVVSATLKTGKITVGASTVPAGLMLTVFPTVAAFAGIGVGTAVDVSIGGNLVTAIPSVATGTSGTSGTGLSYALTVTDTAELVADQSTVTITYTLTSDQL